MLVVKVIPNIFENVGRTHVRVEWRPGATVREYLPAGVEPGGKVCIRSGGICEQQVWDVIRPLDCDELIFFERPEFEATAIALLGYVGVTNAIAVEVATAALQLAVSAAISVGAGALISKLSGQSDQPRLLERAERKVHTFNGVQTTASSGDIIPVVYGTHPVGGNVISLGLEGDIVDSPADQDFEQPFGSILRMIIACCEGEVDAFLDVKVNGNDVSQYQLGSGSLSGSIFVENRKGTLDQTPLAAGAYDAVENLVVVGIELQNHHTPPLEVFGGVLQAGSTDPGEPVLSSTVTPCHSVFINILHPEGLFHDFSLPLLVQWDVRFKPEGAPEADYSSWQTFGTRKNIAAAFTSSCRVVFPELGLYDIQVRKRTGTVPGDPKHHTKIEWDSITELIQDLFSFPGTALMAFGIYASPDLNGASIPEIAITVRRKCERWNSLTEIWESDAPDFSNPAWIAIDILTARRYGGATRYQRDVNFDLPNWAEFADWCNDLVPDGRGGFEKRCTFDGVFEGTEGSAWDAALRVLSTARATLVKLGNLIKVKWERPREISQTFNVANIHPGSWRIKYVDTRATPTRIDVRFLNKDISYHLDVASAEAPEAIEQNLPLKVRQVDAFGIVRESQARRHARYLLNLERRLNKVVSFSSDLDAIRCEVGDIIGIQHDVPGWGVAGGRVRAGSAASTFIVDQGFELEIGVGYQVKVQHPDDTSEIRNIASGPGSYDMGATLTVDVPWTQTPAEFDLYSIGRTNRTEVPVMISAITTTPKLTRAIVGIVYDPAIHEDSIEPLDPLEFTELPDPAERPPCLAFPPGKQLRYVAGMPVVDVSWSYTAGFLIGGAKVYTRLVSGTIVTTWQLAATVPYPETVASITGLSTEATYEITVIQFSPTGFQRLPGDCPLTTSIFVDSQGLNPGTVKNVEVARLGTLLRIKWDPVSPPPVVTHYEVRRGESWVLSKFVGTSTTTELITEEWAPGLDRFWVRAVSPTGLYGSPGMIEVTLDLWFDVGGANFVRDEHSLAWPGTLTNLVANPLGQLWLVDTSIEGIYESPILSLIIPQGWRMGAILWGKVTGGYTVGQYPFNFQAYEARRWSVEGPIAESEWLVSAIAEMRVASDLAGLAAAPYVPFVTQNWFATYAQFRLRVATQDSAFLPRIANFVFTAEAVP